ncbi:ankyrin repeat-containing domain protein [Halenospora varia]|nr:ankyrin repeat-containing domain protein [Halenospora varia]
MCFLNLPREISVKILVEAVRVRTVKRAMRLRLVSNEFKQLVDESIFRTRILDEIIMVRNVSPGPLDNMEWASFLQTYLAHSILRQEWYTPLGVQIRITGEQVCRFIGSSGEDALFSCVRELCFLTFFRTTSLVRELIRPTTGGQKDGDRFDIDLIDAAVQLNIISLAKDQLRKLSKGGQSKVTRWGNSPLARRLGLASYHGNFEMVELLLDTQPSLERRQPLPIVLRSEILRHAALGGHEELFNFALDNNGSLDLSSRMTGDYNDLGGAISVTAFPSNFQRGLSLFGHDHQVFSRERCGDLLSRVCNSALFGRVEMVEFFLSQGVCLNNPEAHKNPTLNPQHSLRRTHDRPLIFAIKSWRESIVKLMLEHGADANWYGSEETALMVAVGLGKLRIVRLLVEHGADLNEGSPPPIVIAVQRENMKVFKYLLEQGAVLDGPETGGWAMAFAKNYGLESMVQCLVQEGVDKNAVLQRVLSRDEVGRRFHCLFE